MKIPDCVPADLWDQKQEQELREVAQLDCAMDRLDGATVYAENIGSIKRNLFAVTIEDAAYVHFQSGDFQPATGTGFGPEEAGEIRQIKIISNTVALILAAGLTEDQIAHAVTAMFADLPF